MRPTILFLVLCLLLPHPIFAAHWAEDSLAWAEQEGLIQGDEHQDIAPDRVMTRMEFYVFLDRFLPDCSLSPLPQTPALEWARKSLARHLTRNLLLPEDLKSLESPVSREEAGVAIARSYHLSSSTSHLIFTDGNKVSHPLLGALVEKHILLGYPDQTLRPKESLTRAACVSLLHRSLLTLGPAPNVSVEKARDTSSLPFSGLLSMIHLPSFSQEQAPEMNPPKEKDPIPSAEEKEPEPPEEKDPASDKEPPLPEEPTPAPTSYNIAVTGGTSEITSAREGDTVSITAQVPEGFLFSHWEGEGVTFRDAKDESTTFIMPAHNVSIFGVTEKAKPITLSIHFIPTPIKTYQGAKVPIKAPDLPNHVFQQWSLLLGTPIPVTFEDITAQETILHIPKDYPKPSLTLVPGYQYDHRGDYLVHVIGGRSDRAVVAGGDTLLIAANTPEGKVFDHWESEDLPISDPTSWETYVGPVKKESTVRAVYRDPEEGSFAIHTYGGALSDRRQAKPGDTVHLRRLMNRSTVPNDWIVLEKDVTLTKSGNHASFVMPDHDVTVFPWVHLPESLLKVYEPDGRLRKKSDRYVVGSIVRVDARPSYRSQFKSWARTPELLIVEEKGGTISFIMPPQTVTLRAELQTP